MEKRRIQKVRNALLAGLFIMILAALGALPQTGQILPGKAAEAYAETTYTIFLYSGKEGYFGEPGNTVVKIKAGYDEEVTISLADYDLVVKDPKEYYPRGFTIAGHDNDELAGMQLQSYSLKVKEDTSFSVSYGMKGGMVKYRVRYVDEGGSQIHPEEEFYGMAGDRPVVAYRHVEGYLPNESNLTKRLTDQESDNVFTFTYHTVYEGTGEDADEDGDDSADNANANAGGNNANANGNANANAGRNGNLVANNGNRVPGTNITDLDDNDTPLANIEDEDTPKSDGIFGAGSNAIIYAIIAAGILLALLLLFLILRRRGEDSE